ncbi:hypothetical protein P692DRAFT_20337495 [Suillus brevipes Sb2]|nr:hypothetical protein P692DRAFT_20337495 [Suillus brevipes Sb2]
MPPNSNPRNNTRHLPSPPTEVILSNPQVPLWQPYRRLWREVCHTLASIMPMWRWAPLLRLV